MVGVSSVHSTDKSREKQGVTSDSKILLSVTDIHTGAWFATYKQVSNPGVEDEPIKCNKHFNRAISKCKILLS